MTSASLNNNAFWFSVQRYRLLEKAKEAYDQIVKAEKVKGYQQGNQTWRKRQGNWQGSSWKRYK